MPVPAPLGGVDVEVLAERFEVRPERPRVDAARMQQYQRVRGGLTEVPIPRTHRTPLDVLPFTHAVTLRQRLCLLLSPRHEPRGTPEAVDLLAVEPCVLRSWEDTGTSRPPRTANRCPMVTRARMNTTSDT